MTGTIKPVQRTTDKQPPLPLDGRTSATAATARMPRTARHEPRPAPHRWAVGTVPHNVEVPSRVTRCHRRRYGGSQKPGEPRALASPTRPLLVIVIIIVVATVVNVSFVLALAVGRVVVLFSVVHEPATRGHGRRVWKGRRRANTAEKQSHNSAKK